ncbi:MAG TPA: methylamine dehydrogenase accessory protein MauD [Candidatus Binatia bacterium]|nr:methylamine dehydrogenase accessory protein MauD [Candidatus Binatia bacterium]
MSDALLVSTIVLWVVVLILAGVVVALARQIGILYERISPVGALAIGRGLVAGEAAPVVPAVDLSGATVDVGGASADGRSTLVFFLSPTCPVCKSLLPVVRSLARSERRRLRVVLAGEGGADEHSELARASGVADLAYVLSPALGMTWQVPRLPYAVLLDAAGVIRSKGLVNTREHLESLLEAEERGVASLQELAEIEERRAAGGESAR